MGDPLTQAHFLTGRKYGKANELLTASHASAGGRQHLKASIDKRLEEFWQKHGFWLKHGLPQELTRSREDEVVREGPELDLSSRYMRTMSLDCGGGTMR